MKDTRKDLRIRLPDQHREAFKTAKAKAERELGYTLRDNEFAVRVLVQALRQDCRVEYHIEGAPKMTEEKMQEFLKQLKRQG